MSSATFAVEVTIHGAVAAIKPVGWLRDEGQTDMDEQFKDLLDGGYRRFVVDMSALHVLDHSSLGILLFYRRELAARKGCLLLASPSSSARRMLFSHGLHRFLPVFETTGEALERAGQGTPSGRWKPVGV